MGIAQCRAVWYKFGIKPSARSENWTWARVYELFFLFDFLLPVNSIFDPPSSQLTGRRCYFPCMLFSLNRFMGFQLYEHR